MTQDEFDTEQEYYETECDFSDFDPNPYEMEEPIVFDDEERLVPFDYQSDYYEGEYDQ